MTRILEASCVGGVVTCDGDVVTPVTILTQGVQSSTGILILDGELSTYVATNTTDIVTTLTKLGSVLSTIASALTALGAAIPTMLPPPTLAASVASINGVIVEIAALKETLK